MQEEACFRFMKKEDYYEINSILAVWNPLCLPAHVASSEYLGLISEIARNSESILEIISTIETILSRDFDFINVQDDKLLKNEIFSVSEKIFSMLELVSHQDEILK